MKHASLKVRFFAKVIKGITPNDCWSWTGTKTAGYGMIVGKKGGRSLLAHRVSYEIANGKISPDICVLHKCDNRICTNPRHLFLGTRADNNRDRAEKGRAVSGYMPGETNPMAKLNWEIVDFIRQSKDGHNTLGRRFGVSEATIRLIRKNINWVDRIRGETKQGPKRAIPSRPFSKTSRPMRQARP